MLGAFALVVAGCGATPAPSAEPDDRSETISYHCGGAPFTIEALTAPGNAENGGSPPADALRALLLGLDSRWGAETAFLPDSGWRAAGATPTEVVFVGDLTDGTGWANVTVGLAGGAWQVATFGTCIPYAVASPGTTAARWWMDPARVPDADDRSISALVREQACASGQPPDGRVGEPLVRYDQASITIVLVTRPLAGAADCQGAPDGPFDIELVEEIGSRTILDGFQLPARDARTEPEVGFGIGG